MWLWALVESCGPCITGIREAPDYLKKLYALNLYFFQGYTTNRYLSYATIKLAPLYVLMIMHNQVK